jgi:ABC-type lipoprotein release transport system permease subunit
MALAAGRWIGPLLFDQSARDPVVFGTVTAMLLVVSVGASLVPAIRSAHEDPSAALRAE